jgi:hypothetical protein
MLFSFINNFSLSQAADWRVGHCGRRGHWRRPDERQGLVWQAREHPRPRHKARPHELGALARVLALISMFDDYHSSKKHIRKKKKSKSIGDEGCVFGGTGIAKTLPSFFFFFFLFFFFFFFFGGGGKKIGG